MARVCKAVADGDLSQKITVPVQGMVMVTLKEVINTMVDKLGELSHIILTFVLLFPSCYHTSQYHLLAFDVLSP